MSGEFSGLLRENIRIERASAQRDAAGSASDTRDVIGHFRAAAEPMASPSGRTWVVIRMARASWMSWRAWRICVSEIKVMKKTFAWYGTFYCYR